MSGAGNCYDNSAVETFFKTIKAELLWQRTWRDAPSSRVGQLRIHQRLLQFRPQALSTGLESPLAFERKVA